jgi:diguanylate cyclase (GGDEF)-like protein/PAS domain S-box-containing protein
MDVFLTNEFQFQTLTNALAEGLLLFDRDEVLRYLNAEADHLLGWNAAKDIGVRTFKDLLSSFRLPKEEMGFGERAFSTLAAAEAKEMQILRSDGTVFSALAIASPLRKNDAVLGLAITLRDISESVHLRQELQNSLANIQLQKEFYETIFGAVRDGVLLQNEKGIIINANPAAEAFLETEFNHLKLEHYANNPAEWFYEDGQPLIWKDQALRAIQQASNQEEKIQVLHRFRPKPRWLSIRSLVIPHDNESSLRVITTLSDITQIQYTECRERIFYGITRRVLEEQPLIDILQFPCDQLVNTLGYPLAVIGIKEDDGTVNLMAQAGLPQGLSSQIKILWEDTPEGQYGFGKAMRTGETQIHHVWREPNYKSWWPIYQELSITSEAAVPLITQGKILGVMILYARSEDYFDANTVNLAQSFAEQVALALWTSENQRQLRLHNTALVAAANAIAITNRAGEILWANPAVAGLTGYPLKMIMGKPMSYFSSGSQDKDFYRNLWRTVLNGKIWRGELVNRRADGSCYNEEMTITPVRDEKGVITHFIAVKQDISARLAIQSVLQQQEEQYRDMFETMNSAVVVFKLSDDGANFICTSLNRAAELIENLPRQQAIGSLITQVFPMVKELGVLDLVLEVYRTGEKRNFPAVYYKNQRAIGWSEGVIYKLATGEIVFLYDDVTQRILYEKELWHEKERAQVTLASIGDAVITTDVYGNITYLNPAAEMMTGWANHEAVGLEIEQVFNIFYENTGLTSVQPVRQCLREHKVIALTNHTILKHREGGKIFHIEDSVAPIRDREEKVIGAVLVFHDVSEKRALLNRLSHQANHDALTDLPNRLLFKDRLHQAILQASRRQEQVAVVYIDMDDFKLVNDTFGHAIADSVLCQIAKRLMNALRNDDTVARQGGDEFLILLPELSSEQQAAQIARKLIKILNAPFKIDDQETYITASLGIAMYPVDGEDPEVLIQHADMAMYQVKAEGRNHYHFYTEALNERQLERLTLQNEMRRALKSQEFVLHFQPQYGLKSGRICGLEALVRWEHPDRGVLLPGKFISIAEESGLILPLGEWVLRTACAQNKYWQDLGYPPVKIAVNLSARQFRQKNLVSRIAQILQETGLEPQWLELEITESLSMENVALSAEILQKLKTMGICLSIDDFGTGFSSLSYLSSFSLDTLKIDRSFISSLNGHLDRQAIVLTIIQLAKNLGLKVIAEGVETLDQMEFLRAKGCDEVQGFLLAKPVPAREVERYFTQYAKDIIGESLP